MAPHVAAAAIEVSPERQGSGTWSSWQRELGAAGGGRIGGWVAPAVRPGHEFGFSGSRPSPGLVNAETLNLARLIQVGAPLASACDRVTDLDDITAATSS